MTALAPITDYPHPTTEPALQLCPALDPVDPHSPLELLSLAAELRARLRAVAPVLLAIDAEHAALDQRLIRLARVMAAIARTAASAGVGVVSADPAADLLGALLDVVAVDVDRLTIAAGLDRPRSRPPVHPRSGEPHMTPVLATITKFAVLTKYAVLAEATAPGGVLPTPPAGSHATAGTASVSLLLLLALAAWICVKQKGAQWPHIGLGVAIGVVGAGTFVGAVTWNVLGILTQLLSQLGASFG
jgi:hypothetical protein